MVPVYYRRYKRAPQKFCKHRHCFNQCSRRFDLALYVGKFVKNPLHPSWLVIKHNATYDLEDFGEYLDLQAHKKKQKLGNSLGGRNGTLFDTLRLWAYQEVKQHTFYVSFQDLVDRKAQSINLMFLDSLDGVLPVKVLSTASQWANGHGDTSTALAMVGRIVVSLGYLVTCHFKAGSRRCLHEHDPERRRLMTKSNLPSTNAKKRIRCQSWKFRKMWTCRQHISQIQRSHTQMDSTPCLMYFRIYITSYLVPLRCLSE